jgi:hypothetical protein
LVSGIWINHTILSKFSNIEFMKRLIIILWCGLFAQSVYADNTCPSLQAYQSVDRGVDAYFLKYVFKQYTFADGKLDLVIEQEQDSPIRSSSVDAPVEIRRVTFGRGNLSNNEATKACFFQPLAFAQGGLGKEYWGWHMLWSEATGLQTGGLYYARMDGKAWVSSLPKRLTKFAAIKPQFKLENQTITVTWHQLENAAAANMQAISSDEGRSWDIAPAPP